ncbi:hypothetical protein P7C70_g8797, partial [Phenoliferia sp. Uapishka_3]
MNQLDNSITLVVHTSWLQSQPHLHPLLTHDQDKVLPAELVKLVDLEEFRKARLVNGRRAMPVTRVDLPRSRNYRRHRQESRRIISLVIQTHNLWSRKGLVGGEAAGWGTRCDQQGRTGPYSNGKPLLKKLERARSQKVPSKLVSRTPSKKSKVTAETLLLRGEEPAVFIRKLHRDADFTIDLNAAVAHGLFRSLKATDTAETLAAGFLPRGYSGTASTVSFMRAFCHRSHSETPDDSPWNTSTDWDRSRAEAHAIGHPLGDHLFCLPAVNDGQGLVIETGGGTFMGFDGRPIEGVIHGTGRSREVIKAEADFYKREAEEREQQLEEETGQRLCLRGGGLTRSKAVLKGKVGVCQHSKMRVALRGKKAAAKQVAALEGGQVAGAKEGVVFNAAGLPQLPAGFRLA